jgi:hypothetical protein
METLDRKRVAVKHLDDAVYTLNVCSWPIAACRLVSQKTMTPTCYRHKPVLISKETFLS